MEIILQVALVIGAIVILNQLFRRRRRRHSTESWVDPQKVLFSLPTICDRSPAVVEDRVKPSASDCTVWDDFWLQIEFVSRNDEAYVDTVLHEIDVSKEQHREGEAFREIYVREDHPTPLEDYKLSLRDLRSALLHPAEGRLLIGPGGGSPMLVDGGFALALEGIGFLYGCEAGGVIQAMGIHPKNDKSPADVTWQRLRAYMKRHNLILVDWLRGEKVVPEG